MSIVHVQLKGCNTYSSMGFGTQFTLRMIGSYLL